MIAGKKTFFNLVEKVSGFVAKNTRVTEVIILKKTLAGSKISKLTTVVTIQDLLKTINAFLNFRQFYSAY